MVDWSLFSFIYFIYFNFFRKNTFRISKKALFFVDKNCVLNIHKKAKVTLGGIFIMGAKPNPKINNMKLQSELTLKENSEICIKNNFSINHGSRVVIFENAKFELGGGFINTNADIGCKKRITIGNNCMIADYVVIMDTDFHKILLPDYEATKPIKIGNHVWIGNGCKIFKGISIGYGAIIGGGSVVVKSIPAKTMAAGNPAKVLKENVEWE
jgi:acetyltransferase-like isoleucine patch superfamily enzyme